LTDSPHPGEAATGVSAVMVVYRTGLALADSLALALAEPAVNELVVVDNGSPPDEAALLDATLAANAGRMRLIRGQGNVGFARAANLGARTASRAVLVFLNPDAFLEPGCIAALEAALALGTPPVLVGARVMDADGQEQRGARRGDFTLLATMLSLSGLVRLGPFRRFELHHERDPVPAGPIPTPTVSGACFAMRRDAFLGMGGFDEGYFLHVEDVDLCWRVRRAGGSVLFQPAARVGHLKSTSHQPAVRVEYWKGRGLVRYFHKRAEGPVAAAAAAIFSPLILLASVARPLLAGRGLRPHR
jgi:N-acetylglucosaminyl-diphospho-decaprenol L-rhamnosyltransferase